MPYRKPILKEILAELQLVSGSLRAASCFPAVKMLADAGFTDVDLVQVNALAVGPTGMNASSSPRVRCFTPSRTRCVQLSDDLVIINYTDVYPGKGPFLEMVHDVMRLLGPIMGAQEPVRTSVVTVDELRLADGFRLGDYIHCGAVVPGVLADAVGFAQTQTSWSGGDRQLELTMQPGGDGTTGVLLRSWFHARVAQGEAAIETLLNESSAQFRSLVTARTVDEIMGGEL